jgi:dihydrofolate reductase
MTDGTVLVHRTMSLDGFIAGPGDDMGWIFEYPAPDGLGAIMRATGAILAGRRTYEVGRRDTGKPSGGPYGGAWSGPIFVLTHDPPADEADPVITFVSGDIRSAVATAREAAGGKTLEVFGAGVAAQCLAHGLVDEILVHLAPVLLGAGVPLFGERGPGRVDLEPVGMRRSGVLTNLHYRVRR